MNQTQGDGRILKGERVVYVIVLVDEPTGQMKLLQGVGDVVELYTEDCSQQQCEDGSIQSAYEKVVPPSLWNDVYGIKESAKERTRVVGCDIRCVSIIPKQPSEVPKYYHPKSAACLKDIEHQYNGYVAYLHIPIRHIIRCVSDLSEMATYNMDALFHLFSGRAPYGFSVLYNELKLQNVETKKEEPLAEIVDEKPTTMDYDYDEDLSDLEKKLRTRLGIEDLDEDKKEEKEKEEKEKEEKTQKEEKEDLGTLTRRLIFTCIDFGVDYDGVLKLVVKQEHTQQQQQSTVKTPILDPFLFHGSFAEVGRQYYNCMLYKLPLAFVHGVFDTETYGEQTFESVLRPFVCNTLPRFRVKSIRTPAQSGEDASDFYFGFTEDDIHFASNRQLVLRTEVPPLSKPSVKYPGYEERSILGFYSWLDMCTPNENDLKTLHRPRKGHCIYGKVLERTDGKVTLDWCSPPAGMDLLRVYLATYGRSKIFRSLTQMEIWEKMTDKGQPTLASNLFMGIMEPSASNDAIDYVKKELIWNQQ